MAVSNYITICTYDFSKVFSVYYEGFFAYDEISTKYDIKDYIIIHSGTIDIIKDNIPYLMYSTYLEQYYFQQNHRIGTITPEKFQELFKPLLFGTEFDTMIYG